MRRECREFFPDHAGKGSLLSSQEAESGLLWMWAGLSCFLSSYEAETGLLWMWAELSCFLLSGDGYVGELLDLQQGCG